MDNYVRIKSKKRIMDKNFSTTDFYLAAYLLAKGCGLVSHSRHLNHSTFQFEDTPVLRLNASNYYSQKALIEPVAFGIAFKSLKSMIHSSTFISNSTQHYVTQSTGIPA